MVEPCPYCGTPADFEIDLCPGCGNGIEGRRRVEEIRADVQVARVLNHLLFDAEYGADARPSHKLLDKGIAPLNWPGWDRFLPPLGRECGCSVSAITAGRARRMIAAGEGFDLTKSIPEGAGPDPGWPRVEE